jgi:hypothetical protein
VNEFISKFKQTSYYKQLFEIKEDILLIFLGGSRCRNLAHDLSDYDIGIITLKGDYKNIYWQCYLKYNNKKVHWYYCPIQWFFNAECTNLYSYTGILSLREVSDDIILYKNPKYEKILEEFFKIRKKLLIPVCYQIFDFKKDYIADILNKGCILSEHLGKTLYFLCLTSYYLFDEPFDVDFLKVIKLSKHSDSIPNKYKQKIIERLKLCKNYIEQNPIDVRATLGSLYKQVENKISNIQEN